MGAHTNEKLLEHLSVGGYAGYGVKDKRMKYGGDVEGTLNRSHSIKLKYEYQNTLREVGGNEGISLFSSFFKTIVATRFEYLEEHKVEGGYHVIPSLKLGGALAVRDVATTYDYAFRGNTISNYRDNALQVSLRYAVGEQNIRLGLYRFPYVEGNPVFNVRYTRGLDLAFAGDYAYNRFEASMDAVVYHGRVGQSRIYLTGGYVDSGLPYGLLFTGEGSGNSYVPVVVSRTFQTMKPNEFLSDRYAHLFYAHNFGRLFKWWQLRPELTVAYKAGWGDLRAPAQHAIDFRIKDNVYQEAGFIVNNLWRVNYLGAMYLRFGVGAYLRLGYYQHDKFGDNVAVKISITMATKE
jgi:hypothetical protein